MNEHGHQFLLPVDSPVPVQPFGVSQGEARSQVTCKVENILVSSDTAQHFALRDLRVGQRSMFASAGMVPLRPFGVDGPLLKDLLTARSGPPVNGDVGDIVRPLLELGPLLQGQCMTLQVENLGPVARLWEGALVVRAAPVYTHRDHVWGKTRSLHPPRDCEVCAGELESIGDHTDWCPTCGSVAVAGKLHPSAFSLVADDERLKRVREAVRRSRRGT